MLPGRIWHTSVPATALCQANDGQIEAGQVTERTGEDRGTLAAGRMRWRLPCLEHIKDQRSG